MFSIKTSELGSYISKSTYLSNSIIKNQETSKEAKFFYAV